ncbi:hypothetical protein EYF80_006610 [Liparis tanakae]|uniref:Uncharacterized protein n=1 Tax=Liparis tanakae TaxID=230148 RepID=A0A4Z2J0M0_9TELE|nr:hypothetical protein EYF80_006610 [Liparis tanakae]
MALGSYEGGGDQAASLHRAMLTDFSSQNLLFASILLVSVWSSCMNQLPSLLREGDALPDSPGEATLFRGEGVSSCQLVSLVVSLGLAGSAASPWVRTVLTAPYWVGVLGSEWRWKPPPNCRPLSSMVGKPSSSMSACTAAVTLLERLNLPCLG